MSVEMSNGLIGQAAAVIRDADALLISAGAGMGVDSGLPDFRGVEGFWKAYPPYQKLGLRFEQMANPALFDADPELAWGFYGHRLDLYRKIKPHAGFTRLLDWALQKPDRYFVFTSNVDGQFQSAGFADDRVVECHGSIHHFQCSASCDGKIWPATESVEIDSASMRAVSLLPRCPSCGGFARPNILMFGDGCWVSDRTDSQNAAMRAWNQTLAGKKVVVIESGAGTAIPTVRHESERAARRPRATLVRINVREPQGPSGAIQIAAGAMTALEQIAAMM